MRQAGDFGPAVRVVLAGVVLLACGCSGQMAGRHHRNRVESIAVVNPGDRVAAQHIQFVLELKESRRIVSYDGIDEYLVSKPRERMRRPLRAEMVSKAEAVGQTLSQARGGDDTPVVLTKPDPSRPFSRNNIVLYMKGRDGFHVYFGFDEIDAVFEWAFPQMKDDLETIVYRHPNHDSDTIAALRARLIASGIELRHAELSDSERETLRIQTAAGVLEKELRRLGVDFVPGKPLLQSGLWGTTRSPKLTAALEDEAVLDRLRDSPDRAVARAIAYLMQKRVIKLARGR